MNIYCYNVMEIICNITHRISDITNSSMGAMTLG